MVKQSYSVIGVMSGTSLDGVDLAHIHFVIKDKKWSFTILQTETVPYPPEWIHQLKSAVNYNDSELKNLNEDYTHYLSTIIKQFISKHQLDLIDAVCSHGHTILHQPQNGFTLQIGNLPAIAKIVGKKVICDFRVQDVLLGGQGAPLVPIGDRILFSDYDYCLNLGGFSNISFENNGNRIAFDISPVNTVLNFYANQLGFDYDNRGEIARNGEVHLKLLNELNELDYYKKQFPKSLGIEYVNEIVLPLIEKHPVSTENKIATFTEHIAIQISLALPHKTGKLLTTGGGAYNNFLLERIKYYLPKMQIIVPDKKTIEFKEALIFALLGVLKLRNEINVLSSVTGAKKDHSSGIVFL